MSKCPNVSLKKFSVVDTKMAEKCPDVSVKILKRRLQVVSTSGLALTNAETLAGTVVSLLTAVSPVLHRHHSLLLLTKS